MSFRTTSALDVAEIGWIRAFLAGRPMFQLYFEAALDALREGLDNRAFLLTESGAGLAVSIDFDTITIRTTIGELTETELAAVADVRGPAELHLEPAHLAPVRSLCGTRVTAIRTLRYYEIVDAQRQAVDARCRILAAGDAGQVAGFFRCYYPATVFSSWMLELPFLGLFEDGELLACGGTHAMNPKLGSAVIGNFLTRPDQRGRGLAQAVARALMERMAGLGYRRLLLGAAAENVAACRAYEAVGFGVIEERPQVDLR